MSDKVKTTHTIWCAYVDVKKAKFGLKIIRGASTVLEISPKPKNTLRKMSSGKSIVANFRRRHSGLIKKCTKGSGRVHLVTILSTEDGQSLTNDWRVVGNDLQSGIEAFEPDTEANERANAELTGTR